MKILIPTAPDDTHTIVVKMALEKMGHSVHCIFTADQPTKQKNSVFIDNAGYQWKSADKRHSDFLDNHYDVVWWRRARKPYVPAHAVHQQDYKFIVRENNLFYESLTNNMAPHAWWVNPKDKAMEARSKLLQLKIAMQCGMFIPTTLCSNDPQEIRSFFLKHEKNGVIYKPLSRNGWQEEEVIRNYPVSQVIFNELPPNQLLQCYPSIFQQQIKQKYALQVVCFGNYLVAAKLFFHDVEKNEAAVAEALNTHFKIEPYILPITLANQIRACMRKMGLLFAVFNFIVTPEDRYIFLGINEQGQFLWMEECHQDFHMLDIFVNFLLSRTRDFHWQPQILVHQMDHYLEHTHAVVKHNMRYHVGFNSLSSSVN